MQNLNCTTSIIKRSLSCALLSGFFCFTACYNGIEEDEEENNASGSTSTDNVTPNYDVNLPLSFTDIPQLGDVCGGISVVNVTPVSDQRADLLVMTLDVWENVSATMCDSILDGYHSSGIDCWRLPTKKEAQLLKYNFQQYGFRTFNLNISQFGASAIDPADYYYCVDEENEIKRFTFSSGNILSISDAKLYFLRGFSSVTMKVDESGLMWNVFPIDADNREDDEAQDEDIESGSDSGDNDSSESVPNDSLLDVGYLYHDMLICDIQTLADGSKKCLLMASEELGTVSSSDEVASVVSNYANESYDDWRLPSKDEVKILKSNLIDYGLNLFNKSLTSIGASKINKEDYYYCIDENGVLKRFTFNSGNILSVDDTHIYKIRVFRTQIIKTDVR